MTADVCSLSEDAPAHDTDAPVSAARSSKQQTPEICFKKASLFLLQGTITVFNVSGQAVPTKAHLCFLLS